MKLAFEEHGNGMPVVLIHAFPLSRKMWKPQIDEVTKHNFKLILPDLRGFGESHNFSDIHTMEDMANDVAELLNLLEIEKAIIGGLSMGGYVTLNMYRLFPDKFAAMILCDTTQAEDTKEKQEARFNLIDEIDEKGMQKVVENVLPNLLSDYTKKNNQELVAELEEQISKTNKQATISALRGMAQRKDQSAVLGLIEVPTVLIFGEDDMVTYIEDAKIINNKIPNSELKIIKQAGHYSNLEQPNEFNIVLIDFLKNIGI